MSNDEFTSDPKAVAATTNAIPAISSESYQHIGRYAGAAVLAVFEQLGGVTRMHAWADSNPTDFYTKLFPKMIQRSQQVDVSGSLSLDDAISALDRKTTAYVTTDYTVVEPLEYDL